MDDLRNIVVSPALVKSGSFHSMRFVVPYVMAAEIVPLMEEFARNECLLFIGMGTDSSEESCLKSYYGFVTFQCAQALKALSLRYKKIMFQPCDMTFEKILETLSTMRDSFTTTASIVPAIEYSK